MTDDRKKIEPPSPEKVELALLAAIEALPELECPTCTFKYKLVTSSAEVRKSGNDGCPRCASVKDSLTQEQSAWVLGVALAAANGAAWRMRQETEKQVLGIQRDLAQIIAALNARK